MYDNKLTNFNSLVKLINVPFAWAIFKKISILDDGVCMYVIDKPARPWSAVQITENIVLNSLFLCTGIVSISYLYSEALTH